jgi:membrane protease YdiL (CAAX protease family)
MPPQNPPSWPLLLAQGACLAVSLTTWALWLAGRFREPLRELAPPAPIPTSPLAAVIVVLLVAQQLGTIISHSGAAVGEITPGHLQMLVGGTAVKVGLLLVALWLSSSGPLAAWGFHLRRWPRQLAAGLLAAIASMAPVFAVLLLTLPLRDAGSQHALLKLLRTADTPTVLWVALAVLVSAPLAEELMYRVILQTNLESWCGPRAALVVTAVVFSGVHGWPDALPLFPLALVLGCVYQRSRSYLPIVLAHALFNLWNLAWALSAPVPPPG